MIITRVHHFYDLNNEKTSTEVQATWNEIKSIITEYCDVNAGKHIGLNAYCVSSGDPFGEMTEKFPLILDWDDIRVKLIEKNNQSNNMYRYYVSGESL